MATKQVRRSVTLDPWGMYAAGKKEKRNELRGEDLSAAKQERGRLRGTLGAGTTKQEEKGSSGNGRWAGEPERAR